MMVFPRCSLFLARGGKASQLWQDLAGRRSQFYLKSLLVLRILRLLAEKSRNILVLCVPCMVLIKQPTTEKSNCPRSVLIFTRKCFMCFSKYLQKYFVWFCWLQRVKNV